jgi:hypothetical protein
MSVRGEGIAVNGAEKRLKAAAATRRRRRRRRKYSFISLSAFGSPFPLVAKKTRSTDDDDAHKKTQHTKLFKLNGRVEKQASERASDQEREREVERREEKRHKQQHNFLPSLQSNMPGIIYIYMTVAQASSSNATKSYTQQYHNEYEDEENERTREYIVEQTPHHITRQA